MSTTSQVGSLTFSRDALLLVAMLVAVGATAGAALYVGKTTVLEAASFVTGAICVWLTVKQNVWNFPVGLLNVATFFVVFFQARLFADAGLQLVYFGLGVAGWYLWLYGGEDRSRLKVSRVSAQELAALTAFCALGTLGLWAGLHRIGGSASFWDALTTSISLMAQWLLNGKRLESWICWIVVDALYVPLYVYKELYLTALLYAVFLGMAVMGYRAWRLSMSQSALEVPGLPPDGLVRP